MHKTSLCLFTILTLAGISACNQTAPPQENTLHINTELVSGINLDNIDKNVRPQDNFYRFVNGHWLNTVEIPGDKTSVGAFYELRDQADDDVKAIITELAQKTDLVAGSDKQKVGDLYKSYMNMEHRNSLGLKPIEPILNEINSLTNKTELAAFFGRSQAQGLGSPLYLYVSVDAKKSQSYAAHIWQSGLGLPDKDYYFNEGERFKTLREGYVKHITNTLILTKQKSPKVSANVVMSIETQLADFHWTRVQSRDSEKRYNKYAISTLHDLGKHFNWANYFQAQGLPQDTADIIINQPSYIQGFDEIFAQTSLDDWKTYLTFHAISQYSSSLTQALNDENFDFYSQQLSGLKQQKPLWKKGVKVVNSSLGEAIGKIYVTKHFPAQAKVRMNALVENLRQAYSDSINELDWMSEKTKAAAQVKLAAFKAKIGYPDKWQAYDKLVIKPDDLVGNMMRANIFEHQEGIAKLGQPIKHWEWEMTPQTVNAYYNPPVNEIVFPAAILQAPFFNMAADDAVNYGGIGAVIGHEMGHGFDDQGSKYDAKGNLRNWWTEQDLAAFTQRASHLVEQYNNYKVFDDLHINGELTLGENIGDLSGVTIAYKAYKASLKGKEARVIDGLTGEQRFFMGYAQVWRSKAVEKSLRNQIATDPHSPGEFRALGSLSNMPEFYRAFDVKKGDAMYIAPEKRVKIW